MVQTARTQSAAESSIRRGLLGLFEYLGFNPPHPRLGDLHATDEATRSQNRKNSVRLLEETRRALKEYGYDISSAQPGEIWTKARRAYVPSKVWVSLVRCSGSLDVGLSCPSKTVAEALTGLLPVDPKLLHREACEISFRETMQKDEACRYSVDTRVPLLAVLGSDGESNVPEAIADAVMDLVKVASRVNA